MSFHKWESTDTTAVAAGDDIKMSEVHCQQCGTTTPEWGFGAPYYVTVSHGCLPLTCPGNVENPHHYWATGTTDDATLECHHCQATITSATLPDAVDWECLDPAETS